MSQWLQLLVLFFCNQYTVVYEIVFTCGKYFRAMSCEHMNMYNSSLGSPEPPSCTNNNMDSPLLLWPSLLFIFWFGSGSRAMFRFSHLPLGIKSIGLVYSFQQQCKSSIQRSAVKVSGWSYGTDFLSCFSDHIMEQIYKGSFLWYS